MSLWDHAHNRALCGEHPKRYKATTWDRAGSGPRIKIRVCFSAWMLVGNLKKTSTEAAVPLLRPGRALLRVGGVLAVDPHARTHVGPPV